MLRYSRWRQRISRSLCLTFYGLNLLIGRAWGVSGVVGGDANGCCVQCWRQRWHFADDPSPSLGARTRAHSSRVTCPTKVGSRVVDEPHCAHAGARLSAQDDNLDYVNVPMYAHFHMLSRARKSPQATAPAARQGATRPSAAPRRASRVGTLCDRCPASGWTRSRIYLMRAVGSLEDLILRGSQCAGCTVIR